MLTLAPGTSATTYRVAELDCATEERELRDVLAPLAGVRDLSFDLVARRVTIAHTLADPAPLAAAIATPGCAPRRSPRRARPTARRCRGRVLVTTVVAGVLAVGSEVVVIAGLRRAVAARRR